jgi:DNA-binding protein HU-beta
MNKAQFIAFLAPHFDNNKKEAARAVDIVFDSIVRNISKGDDVMINDFGKFKKVDRAARKGRNPFTGETIQIKASKKVRFLPAKALKEIIAGARKLEAAAKPPVKAVPKVVASKAAAKKAPAKAAPAKKVVAKKAPAKKAPVKAAPAKKVVVSKAPAKKAPVKAAPAKKVVAAKAPAKKAPAKVAPAKKAPAKKK